ncbi:hypothetical protein [Aestuariimicrobium ganziense]|uniref:hypothetical protein n=1 Tax=Aestuariimicrobium ganziense TaxID=2773677 RepID=UPI001940547D|nr:hypothetical protein [Aestuariimicrobium ganziense]
MVLANVRVGPTWLDVCIEHLGGSLVEHDWGELPWTVMRDPRGNELCVLGEP